MNDPRICPWCNEGRLKFVNGYEPWSTDHYACELCNSTYNLFEFEKTKEYKHMSKTPETDAAIMRAGEEICEIGRKMERERNEALATIKLAIEELHKIGLHPAYHPTLPSCVQAAKEIVSQLRKDIDEPRPDIQEAVLHKLGLWDVRQQRDQWQECAESLAYNLRIYMEVENAHIGTAALSEFERLKEASK